MKTWCWLVSYGWHQHWIMITIKVDDRKILFVSHDKITKIKWKWNLVWNEILVCCVCVYVMKTGCWLVSYGWYHYWIMITITVDDEKNTVRVTWQSHKNKIKMKFSLDWTFGLLCVCMWWKLSVDSCDIWLISTLNYDHDKSWWQKNSIRVTWQNHKNKMKTIISLEWTFS